VELTQALTFARPRHQGVLTTIKSDGRPQISNIAYALMDGDVALISVTDGRAKTANLRRDPRASLYVLGDTFYQWAVLEGAVELTPVVADPHDATADLLVAYYKAANGEHDDWEDYRAAMVADKRLVLKLRPERAYGMGI